MKSFAFKFPTISHRGHTVSHAKNRKSRKFRYNLHTVTVKIDGEKKKMRVPSRVLKVLKAQGITTHYKKTNS